MGIVHRRQIPGAPALLYPAPKGDRERRNHQRRLHQAPRTLRRHLCRERDSYRAAAELEQKQQHTRVLQPQVQCGIQQKGAHDRRGDQGEEVCHGLEKENAAEDAKEEARKKARREGKKFDEDAFGKTPKFAGRPDDAKIAGDEPAADKKDAKPTERIAVNGKSAADSIMAQEKKAAQDTAWMKNEYVPVTSFIHTLKFDNYSRTYIAYQTPADYYLNEYYTAGKYEGDSIYDNTKHWEMKNTLALATLEGFSKWAKAGLKAFVSYDLRHFELPDTEGGVMKYNEHSVSVGGQLSKRQGKLLHYNAVAEIGVAGEDAGTLAVDGDVDVNISFLGDTLSVIGSGFFHRITPSFYFRNYHGRHFWWENDLDKIIHTRIMGTLKFAKTKTMLRVAVDEIKNYAYLSQSYNVTDNNRAARTGE